MGIVSALQHAGPVFLTGTEIALAFSLIEPLLERGVGLAARRNRPIPWLTGSKSLRVFGASYLYSLFMFGLNGLPRIGNRPQGPKEGEPFGDRFLHGGLVMGFSPYLGERFGEKAPPLIWLADYLSNVFLFSPLIAGALGAPIRSFVFSGALVYWSAILGAARMTQVWAPQGEEKELHIVFGRALIFLVMNTALAFKGNRLLTPRQTNVAQISTALTLWGLVLYITRSEQKAASAEKAGPETKVSAGIDTQPSL